MSDTALDSSPSKSKLLEKIAALEKELSHTRIAKAALDAQNAMLDNLVKMAETPELEDMLAITIAQALDISEHLTGAECSCLVLFGERNQISETIIEQSLFTAEQQASLKYSVEQPNYVTWLARHKQTILIPDTNNSDRWIVPPNGSTVAGSVVGVPILKGHTVVGVLTLVHSKPSFFKSESVALMDTLGKQIALGIEFARFYGELETYSNALQIEVEKGREMQRNFLPNTSLDLPGWETSAYFKPAKRMAGDFYDSFMLANGLAAIVIGDVCDKGVGAALFMGLFRSLLRVFSEQLHTQGIKTAGSISADPEDIEAMKAVTLTNNYIAQNHSELNMFATLFFGLINHETGVLTYINGGHEAPVILRASGKVERLKATGPVVGPIDNVKYRVQQMVIEPGDIFLGFTDGVTDARSRNGAFFTEKKVLSLISEAFTTVANLTTNALVEYLQSELTSHVDDADPFDDITILAVRRLPVED